MLFTDERRAFSLGPHNFGFGRSTPPATPIPLPALRELRRGRVSLASRPDSDTDTEVKDPDVSAKKTQKLSKQVKVKVKAGAQEPVDLVGKGKISVKKKGNEGGQEPRRQIRSRSVEDGRSQPTKGSRAVVPT